MDKTRISKRSRSPATTILALLLVVCLAESATEQRINSRGSKSSNLIEKVNGWRSQRGGSCLSYGHSCWGAHGKRAGRPPVTAPDWYLTRMLRRMASNAELNRGLQLSNRNEDLNDIFQQNDATNEKITKDNEEMLAETGSQTLEAKPMLDDDLLSKIKLWQIMVLDAGRFQPANVEVTGGEVYVQHWTSYGWNDNDDKKRGIAR